MKTRPPIPAKFATGWPPGFVSILSTPDEIAKSAKARKISEMTSQHQAQMKLARAGKPKRVIVAKR